LLYLEEISLKKGENLLRFRAYIRQEITMIQTARQIGIYYFTVSQVGKGVEKHNNHKENT